mmetsp:Transcript_36120/g.53861  ORF Transcript_36120/g.53861 Transcript_36120/m.53861 type:complete len:81 (+) Transcript_36120:848-1090(+)
MNWDAVSLNVCSFSVVCPCDGPLEEGGTWKNHGKYVSCVAKKAGELVELGTLTEEQKDEAVWNAGESDCGKKNKRMLRAE